MVPQKELCPSIWIQQIPNKILIKGESLFLKYLVELRSYGSVEDFKGRNFRVIRILIGFVNQRNEGGPHWSQIQYLSIKIE